MASEVDICNRALGHIGDPGTISSLDPPEGSVQAERCARIYPFTRDSLLSLHSWDFATTRVPLARVEGRVHEWRYIFALPADLVRVASVLPENTQYICETDETGNKVLYTNEERPVLRYVRAVTDTTKFSALFIDALSWYLASELAGPILKGTDGAAEAKRCLALAQGFITKAAGVDASQRRVAPWTGGGWIDKR